MGRSAAWTSRTKLGVAVAVAILAGAIAVPLAISGSADDSNAVPATPLGDAPVVSAFGAPSDPSIAPEVAKVAGRIEEMDAASLRLLARSGDIRFYLADAKGTPARFCTFAVRIDPDGPASAWNCGDRSTIGTGLVRLNLQTRPGDISTPRVFFGLVPDGVASVSVDGQSASVTNNAYAVPRADGSEIGKVSFTRSDGSVVDAP